MTMRTDYFSRITLLLLIACLALSIVVAGIWSARVPIQHAAADHADRSLSGDENVPGISYSAPPITAFADILERPLFTAGREPPTPAQPQAVTATPAPLRLQVEGVAITPETRIAVVRDLGNGDLLRLPEGGTFQGWILENVNPAGVRFKRNGETQEFVLDPLNNTFRRR